MYNVDYNELGNQQLPIKKRKPKWKSILFSILKPLQTVNDQMVEFHEETRYALLFNAQVIYLEHFLNDQYDPIDRGIYIEDTANIDYTYLHNKIEEVDPVYVFNDSEETPHFLFSWSEYESEVDYIVKVPVTVDFNPIEMRNRILKYNSAGKRFEINTY